MEATSLVLLASGGGLIGCLLAVLGAGGSILLLPLLTVILLGSWVGGSWVKAGWVLEEAQLAVLAVAAPSERSPRGRYRLGGPQGQPSPV
jgi:hypothetical protein